jgi:hypothetical protein
MWEIHGLCRSPGRSLRWTGHVGRSEENIIAYRIFVQKYLGKRILWRLRRLNYNIKVGSKGLSCEYQLWMQMVMSRDRWRVFVVMVLILQYLLHNNSHLINNLTANIDPCLMCGVKKPKIK